MLKCSKILGVNFLEQNMCRSAKDINTIDTYYGVHVHMYMLYKNTKGLSCTRLWTKESNETV